MCMKNWETACRPRKECMLRKDLRRP
jgi:hypothetical protein